eukprot:gene16582-18268_t
MSSVLNRLCSLANKQNLVAGALRLQQNLRTTAFNNSNDNGLPRLVDCRQGQKVVPTFSKQEMQSRVDKLRLHMAEHKIEACVFTSYHNINYFSDFLYCQFGRPYGLVVTDEDLTVVAANIDYGQPWRRSFGEAVTYTDWQRDNFYHAVQKLVGARSRVGLEFDTINLDAYAKMKNVLPSKADLVDVANATMKMRMVKSAEEIALIKNGARIADIGGFTVRDAIGENVPEYEVALASTRAMIREITSTYPHAEVMDTWTWFQSGINTDGAHNPVTTRKIQKGDVLSLNCFPMISGYYTALERTLFFDHADDRSLEVWEANCKVHKRGLEILRPGKKCSEIAAELNEIFKEHNLLKYRAFGYGHSFGVLCHYYGREAGLELREDIETVIEPNMVISMEPMLTIPDGMPGAGGYREHDILVMTEDGAENITKFPFGPEHNIVKG